MIISPIINNKGINTIYVNSLTPLTSSLHALKYALTPTYKPYPKTHILPKISENLH